jgi:hypothetical protein
MPGPPISFLCHVSHAMPVGPCSMPLAQGHLAFHVRASVQSRCCRCPHTAHCKSAGGLMYICKYMCIYIYIYIYLKASPLPPAPVLAAGCWMLTGWLAGWWLAGSWRAGCFRAPPGSWDHWGWVVTPRFPGHTPQCQMEDPGYRIRPAACRIQE